jgi:hypothetical protein
MRFARTLRFVFEDNKLYLLPVRGWDTRWYKNVLKNPSIRIDPRGAEAEVKVVPSTEATQISTVIEKFRHKYGASDMRKCHSNVDCRCSRCPALTPMANKRRICYAFACGPPNVHSCGKGSSRR